MCFLRVAKLHRFAFSCCVVEKQLFASFCELVKFSLALLELMQLWCFQVFYFLFVSGRKNQKYCVYVCGSKCKSALYELVPAWHRFVFNRCVSSFGVCSLRVVAALRGLFILKVPILFLSFYDKRKKYKSLICFLFVFIWFVNEFLKKAQIRFKSFFSF